MKPDDTDRLNCACGGFVPEGCPSCNGCGRTREMIRAGWERMAEALAEEERGK